MSHFKGTIQKSQCHGSAVIVVMVCPLIFAYLILILSISMHSVILFSCHNWWCMCAVEVKSTEPQRILVICCSNSEPHITAVRKFLVFLETKCNVHVVVVDNNCITSLGPVRDWLNKEITLAKKVVLFHSEESVALAWHFIRSVTSPSVALETFMTALEMFSHSSVDQCKLMNVHFAYTPSICVVNIQCGQTFKLMNEFDKFLVSIRGCSSVDTSSLLACHECHELLLAVEEAAAHPHNYNNYGFIAPDDDTDSIDTQSLMSRMAADVGSNMWESG